MLRRAFIRSAFIFTIVGCSNDAATNSDVVSSRGAPSAGGSNTGGSAPGTGGSATAGDASSNTGGTGADGSATPAYAEVESWIEAYKAAHPGNGGKDWDVNAKTAAEVAADPAAARLLSPCGAAARPVIPLLAWEYGGSDHQWINPDQSALVYCVYVAANPSTSHWRRRWTIRGRRKVP